MKHATLTNSFGLIHRLSFNNYLVLRLLHQIKKYFFDRPRTLMIHPSFNCSFNCPYCYIQSREGTCLPFERWIELIKEFKKIGGYSVDFLGGEPLEYEQFYPLADYILQQGLLLNIFTNGENITPHLLTHLQPNKHKIIFAVKFNSAECYEKYYNRPFSSILDKLQLLGQYEFKKMAFIVATKENVKDIDEIITHCRNTNTIPIIERFAPVKGATNTQLQLNARQWSQVLIKINDYWKDNSKMIETYSIINGSTCSCSSNNVSIMQNGDVRPCPEAHPDLDYGNVADSSILQVWRQSRKKRRDLLKIPDECRGCHNQFACRGGCKIYSYQTTHRIDIRDPLCFNGKYPTTYPHCAFSMLRLRK